MILHIVGDDIDPDRKAVLILSLNDDGVGEQHVLTIYDDRLILNGASVPIGDVLRAISQTGMGMSQLQMLMKLLSEVGAVTEDTDTA